MKKNNLTDDRPPSRHDHVGFMVYTPEVVYCSECGQEWRLERDTGGRARMWRAV